MKLLPVQFYARTTVDVARDLLGKPYRRTIGDTVFTGYIVETEAYQSDDAACHAYKGLTKRTAPLFGPVGHTYVYICYGIHFCLNIVSRDISCPAGGVLIRALYSLESDTKNGRLLGGPGILSKALSITTHHNGINVTHSHSEFIIGDAQRIPDELVQITPRIGISKGTEKIWRFCYDHEAYLLADKP